MQKISWNTHTSTCSGHQQALYSPSPRGNIILAYVGNYFDSEEFQVSLEGRLSDLFDRNKSFTTIEECKAYVDSELKKWLNEVATV